LKFTPDIKFVNDETLNEFVVTMERKGAERGPIRYLRGQKKKGGLKFGR
jgi:hypothetical protein